jgi:hypothetical protein
MVINVLFVKKIGVAFLIGFAASIIQAIVNVGPVADLNTWKAVWVSALSGAVVAGFRALLVFLPGVNLVPSDAQSPITVKKPTAKPAAKKGTP